MLTRHNTRLRNWVYLVFCHIKRSWKTAGIPNVWECQCDFNIGTVRMNWSEGELDKISLLTYPIVFQCLQKCPCTPNCVHADNFTFCASFFSVAGDRKKHSSEWTPPLPFSTPPHSTLNTTFLNFAITINWYLDLQFSCPYLSSLSSRSFRRPWILEKQGYVRNSILLFRFYS